MQKNISTRIYFSLICLVTPTTLITPVDDHWYTEKLHEYWAQAFKIEEKLYELNTDHQHLIIFRNNDFGTVLALDGIIQTTERDEYAYHEMLAHVPIIAHGNVQSVLIVGGGDGGMLREVLKHPTVTSVTLVEIDASVIELCKQYLPNHSQGAFDDPRVKIVIQDAMQYVQETNEAFDIIISDATDPVGPGEVLFSDDFFAQCHKLLAPDGIFVNQNGVPFVQADELIDAFNHLKQHFKHASFYTSVIPTYVGGFMTFGWATDCDAYDNIPLSVLEHRAAHLTNLKYYTPALHKAAFILPKFINDMLKPALHQ